MQTLTSMNEIVFVDFEFIASPGERPKPVCMVALEQKSGRVFRLWLERENPPAPPFAFGPRVLMVAYFSTAELSCLRQLRWPIPNLLLDLYVEFRLLTNGHTLPHGRGLLGAMQWYRLDGIEAGKKDHLRNRILAGGPYSEDERRVILDYCNSDVQALRELLPRIIGEATNLVPALRRGEYMKSVAEMEHRGVPVDRQLYERMVEYWPRLQSSVIERVNQIIPVYKDGHFRDALFRSWVEDEGLDWPTTSTGKLVTNEDTFREVAARCPQVMPLYRARQLLGKMHKPGLAIGVDGRNRCMLSPYSTKTGRCAPSTAKFIFAAPSFMRALIKPEAGKALAYLDFGHQEFGIGAALSGDPSMQSAYNSGDPYLAFATYAGAVPIGATKESHSQERALYKMATLAIQYMIGAKSLAFRLGLTLQQAEDLLEYHRRIFPRFWTWNDAVIDYAQIHGRLVSRFGWTIHVSPITTFRSLRNFPLQANAAEMTALACVFARHAGVSVLTTLHDALLIEADDSLIEQAVYLAETAMRKASETVLAGFVLRTDKQIIRYPNRFRDDRGTFMWRWVTESLASLEGRTDCE